jgi:hypothetical protein
MLALKKLPFVTKIDSPPKNTVPFHHFLLSRTTEAKCLDEHFEMKKFNQFICPPHAAIAIKYNFATFI